jgi:hypothetical protein
MCHHTSVGKVLVTAVGLPRPDDVEGLVVEQRHSARALPAAAAQAGDEHAAGSAMHGVRPGVAGPLAEFLGTEHLDDLRCGRALFGIEDVEPRRADAGDDEVPAVAVIVAAAGAQSAGAGVPAEVVQLVAEVGQFGEAHHRAVVRALRVDVDDGDRVGLVGRPGESSHVGEALRWRLRRVSRRPVEGRVEVVLVMVI